ncbi:MAG: hypothetical protein ACW980_22860 [Promethearchaeota archaeon]
MLLAKFIDVGEIALKISQLPLFEPLKSNAGMSKYDIEYDDKLK